MNISINNSIAQVSAIDANFQDDQLLITLSDGRSIGVPFLEIPWLQWLAMASAEEREDWSLEPNGYAIYWEALDDGIEVCHLLEKTPLTTR
ncbi:MAG: DUF2442 domain-containing protein [Chloroflexota bacterium]